MVGVILSGMSVNFSALDAAIVDLDGTIVDTLGDFGVALNCMLDDLALPHILPADVEHRVGKGSEHLIRSVLGYVMSAAEAASNAVVDGTYVADDALIDQARARYQHHYLAINGQHSQVYPGVIEGLQALRDRGLRLACLTNKPIAFARPLLAAKGLDGFFEHTFGGDAFARQKPDPLPLLKTCEALRTTAARTLMIGDSSNDARAARAAGCPVVLVTYGYNHGEPIRAVDADGYIDSLLALA
jgi:phosphoglycolate phosphatase